MQRYAISCRRALPAHPGGPLAALEAQAAAWAEGGVEWIQIREKDLSLPELEALTRTLAARLDGTRSKLLLNGLPAGHAQGCSADGVHLPGASTAEAIRAARESAQSVSVSCHTLADVSAAVSGGATLIVWAPVFGKTVDGQQVMDGGGLAALRGACDAAGRGVPSVPVFALGGVTPENAGLCIEAGAAGVAGIRLFAGAEWRRL